MNSISERSSSAFAQATALAVLAFVCAPVLAADFYLRAGATTMTMPDGATVPMWGFAPADERGVATGPITVPGPALEVPPNDNALTITVFNDLPEPVSIVIPGQVTTMTPVSFTDGQGRQRVRSFTAETAPAGSHTYTWAQLQTGTYLYHSGTHPAVQVQMGLYGALRHDAVNGVYANVPYSSDLLLLYSEVDPQMHAAVDNGTYGTATYPSTVNYSPRYFLLNGMANGDLALTASETGQVTLLRFVNAGLQTRVPVMLGMDMRLIAEDGKPYTYTRTQYSVMLAAGKTVDALILPSTAGTYTLQERRINSNNLGSESGGNIAQIGVAPGTSTPPIAQPDAYAVERNGTLHVSAGNGVLANDMGSALTAVLSSTTHHGALTLYPDGSFSYMPSADFTGMDAFVYAARDGNIDSVPAAVSISVDAPAPSAPVANDDAFDIAQGSTWTIAAPGVLGNDTDADGDALTSLVVTAPTVGTLALANQGGLTYKTPSSRFTGPVTFTYRTQDATSLVSEVATSTLNVTPNQPAVTVDDTATMTRNTAEAPTSITLSVLANDYDPDANEANPAGPRNPAGTLRRSSVRVTWGPNKGGTAVVNADGTITYTPKLGFVGTERFNYRVRDNLGLLAPRAVVIVKVTR